MTPTDSLLARYAGEIEERQKFIDGLVEEAESSKRDLTAQELELVGRTRDRIDELNKQVDPLREAAAISAASRRRTEEIDESVRQAGDPAKPLEYRTAGEYVLDRWRAQLGEREAINRVELYHRAAAHQTTADNPGLMPESILGPIVNFVDESRPLVSALGARPLPGGSWSRPRVTQHTQVGKQAAQKGELASRKMTIEKVPVAADTYGGYVNVSRQDVDWTQPQIMDVIINDLAGQYAIETENALGDALSAAATAGPDLPATPTAADVAAALWTAAGAVFAAVKGQGRLVVAVPPDMLSLVGPLFAPVNPQNAQSGGFSAGQFGSGAVGAISAISVVMSADLAANAMLVFSTAAAEAYEDRVGPLQVVEPSVLGVQVAYAGYFAPLIMSAAGIIKVVR